MTWRNPSHKKDVKTYAAKGVGVEQQHISMQPIGVVNSPYQERFATPRQPAYAVEDKVAKIVLNAGHNYEQALQDLQTFSHIWIVYWMHLNQGWNPLVKPPRDKEHKHGVFSTRAPHRPNSIGLSLVSLTSIEGRVLHIGNHDMQIGRAHV